MLHWYLYFPATLMTFEKVWLGFNVGEQKSAGPLVGEPEHP